MSDSGRTIGDREPSMGELKIEVEILRDGKKRLEKDLDTAIAECEKFRTMEQRAVERLAERVKLNDELRQEIKRLMSVTDADSRAQMVRDAKNVSAALQIMVNGQVSVINWLATKVWRAESADTTEKPA